MINTKYNYYKTVKWCDIFIESRYNNFETKVYYNNANKLNRLTDKLVMRKLIKKFRKQNKLAADLQLLSNKEQYWY